jgi:hypothetical protein
MVVRRWFGGLDLVEIANLTRESQGASKLAPRDGDSGQLAKFKAKVRRPPNIPATFNDDIPSHPADNRYDNDPNSLDQTSSLQEKSISGY